MFFAGPGVTVGLGWPWRDRLYLGDKWTLRTLIRRNHLEKVCLIWCSRSSETKFDISILDTSLFIHLDTSWRMHSAKRDSKEGRKEGEWCLKCALVKSCSPGRSDWCRSTWGNGFGSAIWETQGVGGAQPWMLQGICHTSIGCMQTPRRSELPQASTYASQPTANYFYQRTSYPVDTIS